MPVTVGKMIPSQYEYFGSEQHDIDMKEIVSVQNNPLRVIGRIHGEWSGELDTAVTLATKDLYTPRDDHSDYLYITKLSSALPVISKIPEVLGFDRTYTSAQIQMQRPGCNMPKHKDPAEIFQNPYRVQMLVTLAPWEYGQYMFFNNTVFREWNAGDVIYTDFQNTWHSTSNMSWHTRPILQIIGAPGEQLTKKLQDNKTHSFNV
jgi:hypothetical protein